MPAQKTFLDLEFGVERFKVIKTYDLAPAKRTP